MGFKDDVSRFVKVANANQDTFMRRFCQEVMFQIYQNTPVKTGFLKNSWTPAIGKPPSDAPGIVGASALAMERMMLTIASLKMGDVLYFVNTAAYGVYVEFGTSRMAARLFVTSVINRAGTIAQEVANRILSGARW